jgi:P4 family phage/plasmid primase-like protien
MPSLELWFDENGLPDMDMLMKQVNKNKKTEPKKDEESKKEEPKVYSQSDNGKKIKVLLENFECFKHKSINYTDWFNIICAIFNSVENKEEGLQLIHQFSKLSDKYDEDGVNKEYKKIIDRHLRVDKKNTIGTLIHMSQTENKDKYDRLFPKKSKSKKLVIQNKPNQSEIETIVNKIIQSHTDYDIAVLIDKLYEKKFITTDIKLKEMYYLTEKLLWDKNGSTKARNYISTKIYDYFEKKTEELFEELVKETDETKKEEIQKIITNISNVLNKVKRTTDKNNILRELLEITDDPTFLKKMNRQEYLIPLKNTKIFNLKDNTLRDRTAEDIFNFECDVEYLEEFDETFADKYFNDLFCNKKDLIQVVLNIVKSCMCGKPLRYIFFLTGDGNNGKSLFMELLVKIFGNFIDTISRSVLLTTKATTHLSTEFEKLGICRIGYVSEMSNLDELNVPTVKQITGDGIINVRGICKTDETLHIVSNQFALTNEMPKIKVAKAINQRLIIIPFNNSFELNDEYKPLLFSHKNNIFNYIMKYGIVQTKFEFTEDMINSKAECIEDNTEDELQSFITEKCSLTQGQKILRNEFTKTFNDWLVKNHKDKDKRTTNKFTRDMKKIYKINSKESNGKTHYLDIQWKFSEEDDEEG